MFLYFFDLILHAAKFSNKKNYTLDEFDIALDVYVCVHLYRKRRWPSNELLGDATNSWSCRQERLDPRHVSFLPKTWEGIIDATNQPFRKENHPPNLHEDIFHVNLQGCILLFITLPETHIFAPESWMVGILSRFLLGVSRFSGGNC